MDEIAKESKRTLKSVESILYRGRKLFRKEIKRLNKEGIYLSDNERKE
jgi:DNA-directed RNA polymerase specialized sigma24 family protein